MKRNWRIDSTLRYVLISRDVRRPDEWTPVWSTRGQCGVTSTSSKRCRRRVLDAPVHGSPLENVHHAWNRLPSGEAVHLTLDRFRAGETLVVPWVGAVFVADRGELLLRLVRERLNCDNH